LNTENVIPPPVELLISVPGPPNIRSTSDFGMSVLSWLYLFIVRSNESEDGDDAVLGVLDVFAEYGVELGPEELPFLVNSSSFGHEQPRMTKKIRANTRLNEFLIYPPIK
jgi:hypothetical protein